MAATTSPIKAVKPPLTGLPHPERQPKLAVKPEWSIVCGGDCQPVTVELGSVHRINGANNTAEGVVETVSGAGSFLISAGSTLACIGASAEPELDVMLTAHCVVAGGSIVIASAVVIGDGIYNLIGDI